MRIGALYLFERGHRNGEDDRRWLIAALHWPWSITWRWLLDWTPWGSDVYWKPLMWRFSNGGGGEIIVRLPLFGQFCFAWQRNMPWKK